MAVARYLVDKSVWARLPQPAVQAVVAPYVDRGLIATCPIIDLEILYSTRNGEEHDHFRTQREAFEYFPMTDEICPPSDPGPGENSPTEVSTGRYRYRI